MSEFDKWFTFQLKVEQAKPAYNRDVLIRKAWNHQQTKIDNLKNELYLSKEKHSVCVDTCARQKEEIGKLRKDLNCFSKAILELEAQLAKLKDNTVLNHVLAVNEKLGRR
jgi:hypothetical protein